MKRIVLASFLALSLAACKKEEKKETPAPAPAPTETKPAETKPAEPAPAPAPEAKPAEPAPAAAPAAGADSEMEAKAWGLMNQMADIMDKDKANCDQLAKDLNDFMDKNKDQMQAMKDYGDKQTPEQKQAFDARHKDDMTKMMGKMMPAMQACKDNKGVQDAMKKMPH